MEVLHDYHMTLDLPQKCPKCDKRKFAVVDSENHEMHIDWEKEIVIPAGTLIRKIKCSYCSDFERNDYQDREGNQF